MPRERDDGEEGPEVCIIRRALSSFNEANQINYSQYALPYLPFYLPFPAPSSSALMASEVHTILVSCGQSKVGDSPPPTNGSFLSLGTVACSTVFASPASGQPRVFWPACPALVPPLVGPRSCAFPPPREWSSRSSLHPPVSTPSRLCAATASAGTPTLLPASDAPPIGPGPGAVTLPPVSSPAQSVLSIPQVIPTPGEVVPAPAPTPPTAGGAAPLPCAP